MPILKPNAVNAFIRRELKDRLQNDFSGRVFRIFRERDLHACTYFHLRRFFGKNSDWEILNEPLLRGLKGRKRGAHPDIALLRNGKLVYLLELKFRRTRYGIQRKDQRTLKRAVKGKKWAKKVFYIEAVVHPGSKTRRHLVPYRSGTVRIQMSENRLSKYMQSFKQLRKPKPRKQIRRHLTSRSS